VAEQAGWLSDHAVNNTFDANGWAVTFSSAASDARCARLTEQRERAGRVELAFLTYAYALEPDYPIGAARMRRDTRVFGVIASFLGEDLALDYESDAATLRLKRALALSPSPRNRLNPMGGRSRASRKRPTKLSTVTW
jgi:hypothetical protein